LSLYLDALDEELVKLQNYISTQEPASAPNVEILKEKARSAEGQTEVGKRDYMVVIILSLSALGSASLTYSWTRTGKFSRVAHLVHISWKVP
jgi:hypothetical protein